MKGDRMKWEPVKCSLCEKKDWIVTMECKVIREFYVYDSTREGAESDAPLFAEDSKDIEMVDWQLLSIEENK